MALAHAAPAQVIDIQPSGTKSTTARTTVLIKTKSLEVIRMVVPAGERHSKHHVPGEITVQCLEGHIIFGVDGIPHDLKAGQMLYLSGGQPHDLESVVDSSVLLTILLGKHDSSDACNDEYAQHQGGCDTKPGGACNTA